MSVTFNARGEMTVGDRRYGLYRLSALERHGVKLERLPYSLRVLLENLLRWEDGKTVTAEDVLALGKWEIGRAISFTPARVLLQDFTGVPCVVDLAAMRDAMKNLGGDPAKVNPLQPVDLVIDHSVQVDRFGDAGALQANVQREFERNRERYAFLKWGQTAFRNFRVVPPSMGICHQVNLEYLSPVVFTAGDMAYPDTLVGTDSHTTMINGLGVLGWGVGGIEAEAVMLGQPMTMLVPEVVGVRLTNSLSEGATATDLVLTVTEMLRKRGVVGKFVEYFGPGLGSLPVADRATIGNMSPEYGATCGIFQVDKETLRYLRMTGRSEEQVALVEAYMKEQGLFHSADSPEAEYTDVLHLDLASVEPSIAGPRRPQDRVPLSKAASAFQEALPSLLGPSRQGQSAAISHNGHLGDGSVVIAAITSCTNTSNPYVMVGAGLLAKKAVERGLKPKPWVKTSLAPGSRVVTQYLDRAGLTPYLDQLGFQTVGYGCTTCIGNSGPLPEKVSKEVEEGGLVVASVLSGNRNFEGRIHGEVRANYLMSPPLVVAFALAGRVDIDPLHEPLGVGKDGQPVFLRDVWPTEREVHEAVGRSVQAEMFCDNYAQVFAGDEHWNAIQAPSGELYDWDPASTYEQHPPYFEGMAREAPAEVPDITGARVLAMFGDSITTDHISPAGNIRASSPAGKYLLEHGVQQTDFNSYGSRRGNHQVMARGTFANVRIRNLLAPGTEGGVTIHLPSGETLPIYDAAMRYREAGTPLIVLAGKEYGSGSSRDWAAKGPALQGVRAVIAESFERIHRSNLVGMGIVPLEFAPGESAQSLGLTGHETYDVLGLSDGIRTGFAGGKLLTVRATAADGKAKGFSVRVRIDTPREVEYYRHGGILQYVLRQLLG